MSLYSDMKTAGLVTGNHESDLYVRDCQEARAILLRHGKTVDGHNVTWFTDQRDGTPSLDIPFRYEPYWTRRLRNMMED